MQTDSLRRNEIPADFPREEVLGSIGGTQPKLLLKKSADGTYGPLRVSEEELQARFEAADDIVGQLRAYFLRKQVENPDWTAEQNLERIRQGLASKAESGHWPFTPAEQAWIMNRLRNLCNL
ncbi:hypothetical protein GTP23_13145 [Pseudoduganella sp. FT93W]|uniref:Uncharacterized protein n=1 Tax=Duganella fentianensis TaxID=2692177 RepID=A0A845I2I5_9BURK|nr:hypothetical protein [Duganella fentianensis]MYN45995.1 hypothetical protein [Duganella fentianensis]